MMSRLINLYERYAPAIVQRHLRRVTSFGLIGFLNVATDFIVFFALVGMGVAPVAANIASFHVSNVQSYGLNSTVTFRTNGKRSPLTLKGYARFWAVHLVGAAASTAIIYFVTPPLGVAVAKIIAVLAAFVCNYALSSLFVFQRPSE